MRNLPEGWVWTTIEQIADLIRGVSYKKAEAVYEPSAGLVPILRATNINDSLALDKGLVYVPSARVSSEQYLIAGDIVLATSSGSASVVGKSASLPSTWAGSFGAFCGVLRVHASVAPYLRHLVTSPEIRDRWSASSRGTNINNLKVGDILLTPIPLPPEAEQCRIVDLLDETVSRLTSATASLEKAKVRLGPLRSCILDLAVRGKLVDVDDASTSVQDATSEIRAQRNEVWDRLSSRGLRRGRLSSSHPPAEGSPTWLPKHWAWVTWSQVGLSQNGRPFPSKDYSSDGVRLLRPGNLAGNGRLVWDSANTRFLPEAYANENLDLLIAPGELVMNLTAQSLRDGFLGRVCLTVEGDDSLLNQRLARLTPTGVLADYMLIVFRSPLFRRFVAGLNSGSLIQHMFTSQVDRFEFPLPSETEQVAITTEVSRLLSLVDSIEGTVARGRVQANALRRSIYQEAFSGGLTCQDPVDEPAIALLERITTARAARTRPIRRGV